MPDDAPVRPDPRLRISRPCPIDWSAKGRDPGGSFCDHCQKTVHDFETMSTPEVETLLGSEEEVCVRLARLPDGTVLTRDHPLTRRSAVVAASALAATALACYEAEIGSDAFVRGFQPRPTPHVVPTERVPLSEVRVARGRVVTYSIGGYVPEPAFGETPPVSALDLSRTVPVGTWHARASVEFGSEGASETAGPVKDEPALRDRE